MKYNTFIFDLDGTLLNTLDDLAASVNYALRETGCKARSTEQIKSFVGNGIRKLIERSLPQDADTTLADRCHAIFRDYYSAHCTDLTRPYAGITDMLEKLKSNGCGIAVVTNKSGAEAERLIEKNFGSLVDYTLGHTDGLPHKPDPEGVNRIIKILGADRNKCIYIGDSNVDCLTAHNAGIPCIGVCWGFREKECLEKAGADYIVETPKEILNCLV